MTIPLIVLAIFAAVAGLILNPVLLKHALHLHALPMDHWLEPLFERAVQIGTHTKAGAEKVEWLCTGGAFLAFATGSGLAYWTYLLQNGAPAKQWANAAPGLHKMLLDKWRVDEAYDATVLSGVDALADTMQSVDRGVVDGILARLSALLVAAFGTVLRAFQTGVVHVYSAFMVVGLAAVGWFFVVPHCEGRVVDKGNGDYEVQAAPGIGYGFFWLEQGANAPEKIRFTGQDKSPQVHLEPGGKKTMELQITNGFGMKAKKTFVIERPKAPEPMDMDGAPHGS
jgi:NADH-quinone oxidoreductase subunit L